MQDSPAPTSTFFESTPTGGLARREAKKLQESEAFDLFAAGYSALTGRAIENRRQPEVDPPDFLFDSAGELLGVELFQLEALYESRALARDIVNAAYGEFHRRCPGDRYLGIEVALPNLLSPGWASEVKAKWKLLRIRDPIATAVRELVDVVDGRIPSLEDLTHTLIPVNEREFKTLSTVTSHVIVRRVQTTTGLRSDGRAAPLVQFGYALTYGHDEMAAFALTKIDAKAARLPAWCAVDRKILVAHDVPRWQREFMSTRWPELLEVVQPVLRTAAAGFDEAWLAATHYSETSYGRQAVRLYPPPAA